MKVNSAMGGLGQMLPLAQNFRKELNMNCSHTHRSLIPRWPFVVLMISFVDIRHARSDR
jgi:hypothetical protein